jgi:ProP effector
VAYRLPAAGMLCSRHLQPDPKLSMTTPTPAPSPAQAARALLKQLQADYTVFRQAKPLAIGIDKQLVARLPELNRKLLRIALGMHTNSLQYLKGMEKATIRFDLDGNTAAEVTDEHRAHAAEILRERFKKNAAQRKAQREAEDAQRKEEEAARQRTEKLNQLASKFSRRGS